MSLTLTIANMKFVSHLMYWRAKCVEGSSRHRHWFRYIFKLPLENWSSIEWDPFRFDEIFDIDCLMFLSVTRYLILMWAYRHGSVFDSKKFFSHGQQLVISSGYWDLAWLRPTRHCQFLSHDITYVLCHMLALYWHFLCLPRCSFL